MTITLPNTDAINSSHLRRLLHEDAPIQILDVRTGGEFGTVHIAGSHNVPLDDLSEHARDLATVAEHVVLVCQSGARAAQAQQTLARAGKHTLHVLEGGIAAWVADGGDVIRGATERWAMDRQVRLVAGSIALAGIAASTVVPGAKWIAGGVGAGLTFSAASNTCAMATVLGKLPYNQTASCDIATVIAELKRPGV